MDNGTLRYIEGDDIERYNKDEEGITLMAHIHHHPGWSKLNWKEIPVSEAASLFSKPKSEQNS